ncbi:hypothetical protein N7492_006835 [Penicillium capsulatum]|uniref:Uncharacterized protein n=1 Tax=Penicillium capsulatum TaxID=69766 RepID=A0A9W9I0Y5_9EURO|nr:hypothetical protein N7492_006835 [Penicillium capsulatum]KAJ6116671.1 hypothetical protein N7512_006396 [Penicillium capsulatum]
MPFLSRGPVQDRDEGGIDEEQDVRCALDDMGCAYICSHRLNSSGSSTGPRISHPSTRLSHHTVHRSCSFSVVLQMTRGPSRYPGVGMRMPGFDSKDGGDADAE